jgi:hypothetical protein
VEATVDLGPDLDDLFERIVAGPTFKADELPTPSDEERRPPTERIC